MRLPYEHHEIWTPSSADSKQATHTPQPSNSDDFSLYVTLRECRKTMAEKEGVPVVALFSNAQLAMMVTERMTSLSKLSQISSRSQIPIWECRLEIPFP